MTLDWTTCTCGKRSYRDRKDAATIRRGHRHRRHLGVYRCPHSGMWHLGHRPPQLRIGLVSRHDLNPQEHQ